MQANLVMDLEFNRHRPAPACIRREFSESRAKKALSLARAVCQWPERYGRPLPEIMTLDQCNKQWRSDMTYCSRLGCASTESPLATCAASKRSYHAQAFLPRPLPPTPLDPAQHMRGTAGLGAVSAGGGQPKQQPELTAVCVIHGISN